MSWVWLSWKDVEVSILWWRGPGAPYVDDHLSGLQHEVTKITKERTKANGGRSMGIEGSGLVQGRRDQFFVRPP